MSHGDRFEKIGRHVHVDRRNVSARGASEKMECVSLVTLFRMCVECSMHSTPHRSCGESSTRFVIVPCLGFARFSQSVNPRCGAWSAVVRFLRSPGFACLLLPPLRVFLPLFGGRPLGSMPTPLCGSVVPAPWACGLRWGHQWRAHAVRCGGRRRLSVWRRTCGGKVDAAMSTTGAEKGQECLARAAVMRQGC